MVSLQSAHGITAPRHSWLMRSPLICHHCSIIANHVEESVKGSMVTVTVALECRGCSTWPLFVQLPNGTVDAVRHAAAVHACVQLVLLVHA
jgi:hypothetical protein